MQHYVIYNYMFRPCKWAIVRLFYEKPDDGPLTRPKYVVVYYIMLHIT